MNGYSVLFGFLALCSFIAAAGNFSSGYLLTGEALLIPCAINVVAAVLIELAT